MRILVIGDPPGHNELTRQVPDLSVTRHDDGEWKGVDLALVAWDGQEELLLRLRERGVPVAACIPRDPDLPSRLVHEFGVKYLFHEPLDCHEFARRLGLATRPDRTEIMLKLWERCVDSITAAVEVLETGTLEDARVHAHRLSGTLGTLGLPAGTELARQLEKLIPEGRTESTVALISRLKSLIQRGPGPVEPAAQPHIPLVLAVEPESEFRDALAQECDHRGLRFEAVAGLEEARAALAREVPTAVIADLPQDEMDALLRDLGSLEPAVQAIVMTGARRDTDPLLDRVLVARLGARGYVQKPCSSSQVLDEVQRQLERARERQFTLLCVDDDPTLLESLQAYLTNPMLRIVKLTDPLKFWSTLEQVGPDMVVLDLDMPHLTGIDICRALRSDPKHHSMPILVLTARNEPATISRVFAAGADDFVGKPFVGPELRSRIDSRLERFRLLRDLIETDPLTGLANRRKAAQTVEQFMRLAQRQKLPIAVALIDVDHFKILNDTCGHAIGDQVLRVMGDLFRQYFRGEDVVARWGGEEFLIAMYGMSAVDSVHRLADLLDTVRATTFWEGQDRPVTFSAGLAQFPEDGQDLGTLCRLADEALYRAKQAGRDRVVGHNFAREVTVISDDAEFRGRLSELLRRRSYLVRADTGKGLAIVDSRLPRPDRAISVDVQRPLEELFGQLRKWQPQEEV